ncbi:tumor necrosis factor ligand superfamily member 14 [Megalops cyprinoides]|uniref:tumor necrosis factor ligand superfamily member 14 n=1 Tax=Megalops cyprinoides TaxID=118141 RepID=UPI0018646408|nr:tumor necrosis factor ligand superfamily member 14 [Megalops cyprinoides]XP_036409433.1 tumor necrosis factor ligand superfamily member 14 [Megalops cyprinoides]
MDEGGVMCPPVFVVDGQAGYPLPPRPPPRRRSTVQWLLFLLVSLALCGMAVEACFIYHLYSSRNIPSGRTEKSYQDRNEIETLKTTNHVVKPSAPAAHLTALSLPPQADGVLQWNLDGNSFTHQMQYREGVLVVEEEGYYFIYSKVFFTEPECTSFTHAVLCNTQRYLGGDTELMQSRRFHCRSQWRSRNLLNSYLGGVYHLSKGDSIYVKAQNHTQIVRHISPENFFGAYMI